MTRARDALAASRRRMPWLAVEGEYAFDGPGGKTSLLDLFHGRRQLIVYRAFFEPGVKGWPEHACIGCSLGADQVANLAHLNARDTTLVYASRAPQADIERVKARMGWQMPWYTITDDFDADFGVDEWHGTNAFIRDGDSVFRTYFIDNRGDEAWAARGLSRHHGARAPRGVGGLSTGLPAEPAVLVVALPRRIPRQSPRVIAQRSPRQIMRDRAGRTARSSTVCGVDDLLDLLPLERQDCHAMWGVHAAAVERIGAGCQLTVGCGRQHAPALRAVEHRAAQHPVDRLAPRYQLRIGGIASVAVSVSIPTIASTSLLAQAST